MEVCRQPSPVNGGDEGGEAIGRDVGPAAVARSVEIRLEERGGAGLDHAVHEDLGRDRSQAVGAVVRPPGIENREAFRPGGRIDGHGGGDAGGEPAATVQLGVRA
jgi:hypothetical protein